MINTTEVMTVEHPRWNEFYQRLDLAVEALGCSGDGTQFDAKTGEVAVQEHPTHWLSRQLLSDMQCDADASLAYFNERGGYCDCEVLFNVDYTR